MDEKMGLSHQIMLYNREKGSLTGILDAVSYTHLKTQEEIGKMRECPARLGFYRFFRAARASFSLLLISSQVKSFSISPPKSLG